MCKYAVSCVPNPACFVTVAEFDGTYEVLSARGKFTEHVALGPLQNAETGSNVSGVQGYHGLQHVAADGGGGHHCPQDCTHSQVCQCKHNYGMAPLSDPC